jgi:hypothetical protein
MSGQPVGDPKAVKAPADLSSAADAVAKAADSMAKTTGVIDEPMPVRAAVADVGDAAESVGRAADSVGDAVPALSGVTDRVAAVAGGVQVATDAAGAVGEAVDNMPKLTPELRRQREALLAAQLAEVRASRTAFYGEMEELEARGRAALDVRSSLTRQPLQIAGLAAGTGFVLLGGPGRAWKYVRRRVIPRSTRPPVPPALDGVLKAMGDDGTAAQELADMIAASRGRSRPGRIQRLLSGSVFLPLGLDLGRRLAARLLDVDPAVRERELARIRARNDARIAEAEAAKVVASMAAAARPTPAPSGSAATGAAPAGSERERPR